MPDFIPAKFCPGCGHNIVLTMLRQAVFSLGLEKDTVLGLDIGCSLLAWNFLPVNTFQTHHGRVSPTMVGFKRARPECLAVGYTGDGGAYAIGLQSLVHAARRDEPILVLVVNNTVYGMTGGQAGPTTMPGQKTPTSPDGSKDRPFFGPELLRGVADERAYLARTATNDIKGMKECLEKAIKTTQDHRQGGAGGHFALVEFLSFCPTNWKTKGPDTIKYLEKIKTVFKVGEF